MDRAAIPPYALRPVQAAARTLAPGEVALVGTGPGDPELLTLRALRMIEQADVVLYDHLVSDAVMAFVPPRAERVYVGKQCSNHAMRQDAINALMVDLARLGKRVVRLKGGDPFIFGRGGEEIETLAQQGVAFQVVPGITAAAGVAAYAGIPLTHRDHAHAVVLVTGHRKDDDVDLDWPALARSGQTIVCYMGSRGLARFCERLVVHGLAASTPAAIVSHGTRPTQRVVAGTLATLPSLAAHAALEPPTLIVVGDVVRLRERLAWFEAPNAKRREPAAVAS
jgi:uroporphyrin-III C-methyltransferase/precorrin-2 dehydrogenase/sirohydrochlorin ferrochelatase